MVKIDSGNIWKCSRSALESILIRCFRVCWNATCTEVTRWVSEVACLIKKWFRAHHMFWSLGTLEVSFVKSLCNVIVVLRPSISCLRPSALPETPEHFKKWHVATRVFKVDDTTALTKLLKPDESWQTMFHVNSKRNCSIDFGGFERYRWLRWL